MAIVFTRINILKPKSNMVAPIAVMTVRFRVVSEIGQSRLPAGGLQSGTGHRR
jgi:hypothetical protein